MTTQLTAEEKKTIITSHQQNIAYNQFNLKMSLVEENAKGTPDSKVVENYTSQIAEMDRQLAALQSEFDSL
jgi:hypothetical protein